MGEFWFDAAAADRAVTFIQAFLRHTKGQWAHMPFRLAAWQRDEIIRPLFGWRRADGTRRYRTAYIEIPRKNGKSTLCSAIALYMLYADGEPGAEVYSAAADREQAGIVFGQARAMVEESPPLLKKARLFKTAITVPSTRSTYKVLSADAYTKHGLNASAVIFDELHAQTTRDLYDVLATSMGARRQPLMVAITTAGYDRTSICWEMHELSRRVIADESVAPTHFAYIAAADEGDEWTDPAIWAKANPALGDTVSVEYLREACNQALQQPAYQNTFRRLHLNQWTSQDVRWLDMVQWDACRREMPDLTGRVCYAGLDLASTHDLAALGLCFPPAEDGEPFWFVPYFFTPRQAIVERARRDRVPYDEWARQGALTATAGNVIDFEAIRATLRELAARYRVAEVAFDRWGAVQISQALIEDGFVMVQFGQGFTSMAHPTSELLRMVVGGEIGHDGHPILRWNMDNLVVEQDAAGNVKPSKRKSREKIDGAVACIMALDRALRNRAVSVYEGREMRML